MAGDWIKVENVTPDKPEVFAIADALGIDPDAVTGKLVRIWIWADQQTTDGNAPTVTRSLLDRITSVRGFTDAMLAAGWLLESEGKLCFPNFSNHNGQTSKARALTSKRVEASRARGNASVTAKKRKCNAETVTEALPEKRREESNTSLSLGENREAFLTGPSPAFKAFWEAYPRKIGPARAWEVWQARVATLVGTHGATDTDVEEFLVNRAEAYACSPAGQVQEPGQNDFRPSPSNWLVDGKYDEPQAEWQHPNGRKANGSNGANRKHRKQSAGPTQRTGGDEEINVDALFDQLTATREAGVEAPTPDGV